MPKSYNPHEGHRDRVRKRYVTEGPSNFYEHQLLELLLFSGYSRRDTNIIAHNMLDKYGSLENLLKAQPNDIAKICNVSINVAILVSLCGDLSRRVLSRPDEAVVLNQVDDCIDYIKKLFYGLDHEEFFVLCLNVKNKVIHYAQLEKGTPDQVSVTPRKVLDCAVRYSAASIIVAHNHPSGDPTPSKSDFDTTKSIQKAVDGTGICLLDHIIVGEDKCYSFLKEGLIREQTIKK